MRRRRAMRGAASCCRKRPSSAPAISLTAADHLQRRHRDRRRPRLGQLQGTEAALRHHRRRPRRRARAMAERRRDRARRRPRRRRRVDDRLLHRRRSRSPVRSRRSARAAARCSPSLERYRRGLPQHRPGAGAARPTASARRPELEVDRAQRRADALDHLNGALAPRRAERQRPRLARGPARPADRFHRRRRSTSTSRSATDGRATLTVGEQFERVAAQRQRAEPRRPRARRADGRLSLQICDRRHHHAAAEPPAARLPASSTSPQTIADRRAALDALAVDFTAMVNGWSAAGVDANGNAGAARSDQRRRAAPPSMQALVTDPALVAAAERRAARRQRQSARARGAARRERCRGSLVGHWFPPMRRCSPRPRPKPRRPRMARQQPCRAATK